jgi:hypothetical protein
MGDSPQQEQQAAPADYGMQQERRPPRPVDMKPGDWICPNEGCKNHNFARRTMCFKCSAPRPAGLGDMPRSPARDYSGGGGGGGGGYGGGYGGGGYGGGYRGPPRRGPMEMRPGDWACSGCGEHNFARRDTCRRCNAPKPSA